MNSWECQILLTPDEVKTHPEILLNLTDGASLAYAKDGFLEGVLGNMRRKLKELGDAASLGPLPDLEIFQEQDFHIETSLLDLRI